MTHKERCSEGQGNAQVSAERMARLKGRSGQECGEAGRRAGLLAGYGGPVSVKCTPEREQGKAETHRLQRERERIETI